MDDKNFKVFQRRTDRIHLSYSLWSALIMFNGIIIAIAALLYDFLCTKIVSYIIGYSVISIVLLVFDFFILRWQVDNKINELLKIDIKREMTLGDVTSKKKKNYCKKIYKWFKNYFTNIIEIIALLFSIRAISYIVSCLIN